MDFGMGLGGLEGLEGMDFGMGLGGLGGLGGMAGGGSFQEIQQQMMQNPESMREMLNSPMMQVCKSDTRVVEDAAQSH